MNFNYGSLTVVPTGGGATFNITHGVNGTPGFISVMPLDPGTLGLFCNINTVNGTLIVAMARNPTGVHTATMDVYWQARK